MDALFILVFSVGMRVAILLLAFDAVIAHGLYRLHTACAVRLQRRHELRRRAANCGG